MIEGEVGVVVEAVDVADSEVIATTMIVTQLVVGTVVVVVALHAQSEMTQFTTT